jgi:hypothetical protein
MHSATTYRFPYTLFSGQEAALQLLPQATYGGNDSLELRFLQLPS